jgi:hypothetical protein
MHPEVLKHARELHQNLAKEECHICKRLFGEHSAEEFNAHALDDVTIEIDIGPWPESERPPDYVLWNYAYGRSILLNASHYLSHAYGPSQEAAAIALLATHLESVPVGDPRQVPPDWIRYRNR